LEDEFSESSKNKNTTKKKVKGVQGELKTDTCTYKGEVLDGRAEGYGNYLVSISAFVVGLSMFFVMNGIFVHYRQ